MMRRGRGTFQFAATGEETEVARLTHELNEALERQAATSEVLQVISGSTGDLEPIFRAMLEKAVRYCEAKFGTLYLREGDELSLVAALNVPTGFAEARGSSPTKPAPGGPLEAVMRTKRTVHTPDLAAIQSYAERHPRMIEAVELGGIRTVVTVPMLKDDDLVGVIAVHRREVRPFTEKQIELVQNFAAQAVIAIENARLINELRQRTDDLTQRTTDLTEALEQQTATSEVLQVISGSPGDLQPVFASMLEKAVRICDATFGNIYRWDGDALHLVAARNTPPAFAAEARRRSQYRPDPRTVTGRMLETKAVVHIVDLAAESAYIEDRHPAFVAGVELGGVRTILAVPMLKEDTLIGSFTVYRQEVRPFTDKQIALVTNFAAQAVIAIENARLLNELRQSLQQQTATSEVLQVISSSPGDLGPVFTTMLEKAVRICEAKFGTLYLHEEGRLRLVAAHDLPEYLKARGGDPIQPAPGGVLDVAMRTKHTFHEHDLAATRSYAERHPRVVQAVEIGGIRTTVAVPMLKDDELIGVIGVHRREVRPFTDKQIALVENFAAQAVIAIENARLLNELRQRTTELTEALEQQTATADVLKVISRSQFDLQLVLDNLIQTATSLCGAKRGVIFRRDGDLYRAAAFYNATPELIEFVKSHPIAPGRHTITARVALERRVIHVADLQEDAEYTYALRDTEPIRTELGVPMFRGDDLVGVFILYKLKVEPFTDKQIELVTTFADQAVIAIENARLLNELRERTDEVRN